MQPIVYTNEGRSELARLFKGVGVEVGVERARFSLEIAQYCKSLYCVDPYQKYKGYRDHVSQERLDEFLNEARRRMRDYDCVFIRKFSVDAARDFASETFDFVYIDANHEYDEVVKDIAEWSRTVKKGGIVAGHDYNLSGVKKALEGIEGLKVWGGDRSPSWSFIKQ